MAITIQPSKTKLISIPVIKSGNYAQPTTYTVSGNPFGMSVTFNPGQTTDSDDTNVVVTIKTESYVNFGTYNLVFSGNPAPKYPLQLLVTVAGTGTTAVPTTAPPAATTTSAPTGGTIYRSLYVSRIMKGTAPDAIQSAKSGDSYPYHDTTYPAKGFNYRAYNLSVNSQSSRSYFEFEAADIPVGYKISSANLYYSVVGFTPLASFGASSGAENFNNSNRQGDILITRPNSMSFTPKIFANGGTSSIEPEIAVVPFKNSSPQLGVGGSAVGYYSLSLKDAGISNNNAYRDKLVLAFNVPFVMNGLSTSQYRSLASLPYIPGDNYIEIDAVNLRIELVLVPE